MDEEFRQELFPHWLEEHVDEERRNIIDALSSEVQAADTEVLEFENLIAKMTEDEEDIPGHLMINGMRRYQRSIVQRNRLNHQVQLAGMALILDVLYEEQEES